MPNVLDQIVEHTKKEVLDRKNLISEAQLYDNLRIREEIDTFYTAITQPSQGNIAIIGELSLKTPGSDRMLDINEVERAVAYNQAGIDAISYGTDHQYYAGDIEKIAQMKAEMSRPILQKDFIIDTYQILESCLNDVDALVLIARILEPNILNAFVEFSYLYGIEPVVEVYDQEDLQKALATQTRVIGVNARNPEDFSVNLDKAAELMKSIPEEYVKIGFSGIETQADVEVYQNAGAHAVEVGTPLLQSATISELIYELKKL